MARKPKKEQMPNTETKKPSRQGAAITFWLSEQLRAALDAYTSAQRPKPSRTEHIVVAIEEYLQKRGAWNQAD